MKKRTALLLVPLCAAYILAYVALRNFGRPCVWTLPASNKEYTTSIALPRGKLTIETGSGIHQYDPNPNDGDVLPLEYRRFLDAFFLPIRSLEKVARDTSIDFARHETQPNDVNRRRYHFNPDYKF